MLLKERLDTKERLRAAGLRLFAERGYEGASVRQIAAAAECGVAALGHHFGTKAGLFAALATELHDRLWSQRMEGLQRAESSAGGVRKILAAFFEPGFGLMTDAEGGWEWALLAWRASTDWEQWTQQLKDSDPLLEQFLVALGAAAPHLDERELASRMRCAWLLADAAKTDRLIPAALVRRGVQPCVEDPHAACEAFLDLACEFFEPRPGPTA